MTNEFDELFATTYKAQFDNINEINSKEQITKIEYMKLVDDYKVISIMDGKYNFDVLKDLTINGEDIKIKFSVKNPTLQFRKKIESQISHFVQEKDPSSTVQGNCPSLVSFPPTINSALFTSKPHFTSSLGLGIQLGLSVMSQHIFLFTDGRGGVRGGSGAVFFSALFLFPKNMVPKK